MADEEAEALPPGVIIMSMASRLVDLQTTRIDTAAATINAPTSAPDAGRLAHIADALFDVMGRRISEGDTGPVSIAALTALMIAEMPDLREEEVRFCARFLNVDRDVRYQDFRTGNRSRLLRHHSRFDQVKLTEHGRIWLRLLRHRNSWLFEDKESEKIVLAINSDMFEQVPIISAELISSLRQYNEDITVSMESPSFDILVSRYVQHRQRYSEMLQGCLDSTSQSLELLTTEAVRIRFEAWLDSTGSDMPLRSLHDWIERVHRAAESLRRNWVHLLQLVQEGHRPAVGVVRFDLSLDAYLGGDGHFCDTIDRTFLNSIGGWGTGADVVSPAQLRGLLPPLQDTKPEIEIVEYDIEKTVEQNIVQSWLLTHRHALLDQLRKGPKSLREILSDPDMAIGSPVDLSGAFGCYLVPDLIGGVARVTVEATPAVERFAVEEWHLIASDVRLVLHQVMDEAAQ